MSDMSAAKAQFLKENLKPGEEYAGLLLGESGEPDEHIFLLPGEATGATWREAKDFAKKAGGELPTRRMQSLLFANLKKHFQSAWYWSCEQRSSVSGYAWMQTFDDGGQSRYRKSFKTRARAVRRLKIL